MEVNNEEYKMELKTDAIQHIEKQSQNQNNKNTSLQDIKTNIDNKVRESDGKYNCTT